MKIFLNKINDDWIIDRLSSDFKNKLKENTTTFIIFSDIIWIIAPWTWKKISKQYLESKGFQPYTIEGSFEDGFGAETFASETSSTLKSIGYVAGTVGVGYLLFQRFLKDKLDKTMNPDS